MPTATIPPRCPHRVAVSRVTRSLTVGLLCFVGTTVATVSLYGQDVEFRFVDPAGHVQPWPDAEPDIRIVIPENAPVFEPAPPKAASETPSPRIAAKWQTRLAPPRAKTQATKGKKTPGPTLSKPTSKPKAETVQERVERIAPPKASAPVEKQPEPPQRACYQAPPLSALSTSIALPSGAMPTNVAAECAEKFSPTGDIRLACGWGGTEFYWSATCMRHRPLYFEEINAERYGYTVSYCLQPVISAARFFGTIPALPYKMVVERPRDCIYTLGHYRPGSCAPRRWHRLPLKAGAAVVETGFIAGLILLLP